MPLAAGGLLGCRRGAAGSAEMLLERPAVLPRVRDELDVGVRHGGEQVLRCGRGRKYQAVLEGERVLAERE